MRRTLVALVLSAVVIVVAPVAPADALRTTAPSGTEQTRAAPLSFVPASDTSTDGNGNLTVTGDPGASAGGSLVLTNTSTDLRLTVRLSAVDAQRVGTRVTFSDEATLDGTGSWITPSDRAIVLEPGASTPVGFKADVPPDAAAGVALGGITARIDAAVVIDGGTAPDVVGLAASHSIAISVTGPPTPQLNIISVEDRTKGDKHYLAVRLRNSGSLPATGRARVRVPTLNFTHDIDISVPPFSEATELIDWEPPSAPTAATVGIEYGAGSTASWSGRVGSKSAGAGSAPSGTVGAQQQQSAPHKGGAGNALLPVLVAIAALAAAAWLGYEFMRSRRRRLRAPPIVMYAAAGEASTPVVAVPDEASRALLESLVARVTALERSVDRLADGLLTGVAVVAARAPAPVARPPTPPPPVYESPPAAPPPSDPARPQAPSPAVTAADFVASGPPVVVTTAAVNADAAMAAHDDIPETAERERRSSVRRTRAAMRTIVGPTGRPGAFGATEEPTFVAPPPSSDLDQTVPPTGAPSDLHSWPPDDELERFAQRRRRAAESASSDDDRAY